MLLLDAPSMESTTKLQVVPVIDLQQGKVVRGAAGQRDQYEPLDSPVVRSSDPVIVARRLVEQFGFSQFYLADLDAIQGETPSWAIYRQLDRVLSSLKSEGPTSREVMVDFGCRSSEVLGQFQRVRSECELTWKPVFGLESLDSIEHLNELYQQLHAPAEAVFSLDLFEGCPWNSADYWSSWEPTEIVKAAIGLGLQTVIVLELSAVGQNSGPASLELLSNLCRSDRHVSWIAGGGVRDAGDLSSCAECGCSSLLIASAIYAGTVTRDEIEAVK